MKLVLSALIALLLTACASFSPVVSVTTTPVEEPAVVASTEVAVPALDVPVSPPVPEWLALFAETPVVPEVVVEKAPLDAEQLRCMALTLYHEARGEGESGMVAVGYVVMNRTNVGHMGARTICETAKKYITLKGKKHCQFTWYCDGLSDEPKEPLAYDYAFELAQQVMRGEIRNPVGASLYFHEVGIRWRYASRFKRVARIGNHIFYA